MHDDRSLLDERLTRTVRQRIRPEVYGAAVPLTLEVWAAPGEPVPVAEALAAEYGPAKVGDAWGAPWATSWFRMSGTVPAEWAGRHVEAVVDLGFTHPGPGFQCEGLAYTPEGKPIKGLAPRSTHLPVGTSVAGGEDVLFYVEAAANPEEFRKTLASMHEMLVDEAPWAWIVHDRNPRAMTKQVQGFVSAQSWFQDLTRVSLK